MTTAEMPPPIRRGGRRLHQAIAAPKCFGTALQHARADQGFLHREEAYPFPMRLSYWPLVRCRPALAALLGGGNR